MRNSQLEVKGNSKTSSKKATKSPERRKKGSGRVPTVREVLAGRPSMYAGKKLEAVVDGNPRREGSWGWQSFEIVRKKPLISYEDFVAKGGRRTDLAWDIAHGFVRVRSRG